MELISDMNKFWFNLEEGNLKTKQNNKMKKIKSVTLLAGWQWELGGVVRKTTSDIPLSQHIPSGDWADPYTSSAVNFTFTPTFIENNKDYFKIEYEPEEPRFEFGNCCCYGHGENVTHNKTEFNRFINWCRETAGETKSERLSYYCYYSRSNQNLVVDYWWIDSVFMGIKFYGRASADLFLKELTCPENQEWYFWYIKQLEKVDL